MLERPCTQIFSIFWKPQAFGNPRVASTIALFNITKLSPPLTSLTTLPSSRLLTCDNENDDASNAFQGSISRVRQLIISFTAPSNIDAIEELQRHAVEEFLSIFLAKKRQQMLHDFIYVFSDMFGDYFFVVAHFLIFKLTEYLLTFE